MTPDLATEPTAARGSVRRTARIGVVVPFDFALDREYWAFVPPDVSLHITRTAFHEGPVGVALARAVADPEEAAEAARTLVAIEPDVIAYACTSGSFVDGVNGERALRDAMTQAGAQRVVTTSGALLEALRVLGVHRVAIGTPYVAELGALLRDFVTEAGFEAASLANLDLDGGIADLADSDVERLAAAAFTPDADALFLSCTNLPTFGVLGRLEQRYGIPVLSANQVTMWAAVRAAGLRVALTSIKPAGS
jgi:maleate isomerase